MVSCLLPSVRVTSPSRALSMPAPAVASSAGTGGQVEAQSPSQFDLGGSAVSASKRYRLIPALSVTTLPSSELADTESLPAAAACAAPWALASDPYPLPEPVDPRLVPVPAPAVL